ncbi:MAG: hypothetical protein ACREBH_00325 [Candidatus Micrarchaeaceae archaeon]
MGTKENNVDDDKQDRLVSFVRLSVNLGGILGMLRTQGGNTVVIQKKLEHRETNSWRDQADGFF